MIASMAQSQNLSQGRNIIGIPPGHKSPLPPSTTSSIPSFANPLAGLEYRSPDVQAPIGNSPSHWQQDLHMSTRWPNNSNESSELGCPVTDGITAVAPELFGNSIGSRDWSQHFIGATDPSFSACSLPSVLPGGSPGPFRSNGGGLSSPLGMVGAAAASLVSTSPRLGQGWTSSGMEHGNLNSLTIDPTKGGFAMQGMGVGGGLGHATAQSLARFSSNPGFAERAARFSAFGTRQFSPAFPISATDTANVGHSRSPSFENDCKRARTAVHGAGRNSLSRTTSAGTAEDAAKNRKSAGAGEGKTSGSRLVASPGCSPAAAEQDDDRERNADNTERAATSESVDGSESGRGGGAQEASCADQVAPGDLRRTSSGKKRKSSGGDESVKDPSSPTSKEHKSSGGQSKRSKDSDCAIQKEDPKSKAEFSGSENSGLSSSPAGKETPKPAEQPKLDYIHVRARRGQATDSHSLAERVRREKISERMKFLQDLVPGCSKVTGKAVMLDEIINYVQSIQRQVEFLSMKLAAVTPRPDFNIDSFLSKQLQIGNAYGHSTSVEHPETSLPFSQVQSQQPVHLHHGIGGGLEFQSPVESGLRRMNSAPVPLTRTTMEGFGPSLPPMTNLWDGDLQSVVQMGFGQGIQGLGLSGLPCDLPPGHMKMEL